MIQYLFGDLDTQIVSGGKAEECLTSIVLTDLERSGNAVPT